MPKVGMEPIRRAETINAALECIYKVGVDNITLEMVAAKAGFSKGIVAYYFKTKKQLILESFKEFFAAYGMKITGSFTKDMQPMEMLNSVVEVSLPRMSCEDIEPINVSFLNGPDKISLPQKKAANLFVQFASKAAIDEDMRNIITEIYSADVKGVSKLIGSVKQQCGIDGLDEEKAAYAYFAVVYGLCFFRAVNFLLPGESDNRDIAFEKVPGNNYLLPQFGIFKFFSVIIPLHEFRNNFPWGPNFCNSALYQKDRAMCHIFNYLREVGCNNHPHIVCPGCVRQHRMDNFRSSRIEWSRRLIGKEHERFLCKLTCQNHTLFLSSR